MAEGIIEGNVIMSKLPLLRILYKLPMGSSGKFSSSPNWKLLLKVTVVVIILYISMPVLAIFFAKLSYIAHFASHSSLLFKLEPKSNVKLRSELTSCASGFDSLGQSRDLSVSLLSMPFLDADNDPISTGHKSIIEINVLRGEALAALHLARLRLAEGKVEKARKLYTHALALDSRHPDIVNDWGEFLEKHAKDVVSAEHMYCRTLLLSPTHSRALINRQRLLPLVEEIDQTRFNRIDEKRSLLFQIPPNHPGMRRLNRENYFMHIHHTTAIEGNTFTLSQTRSLLETKMAIGGKSIVEHQEILGLELALNYVNNTLVNRLGMLSLSDILELHRHLLGFVDPLGAGQLRSTQVFVGNHIPPVAVHLDELMEEFLTWINSPDAQSMHPIEFAALAHYKFVYIHPFYDGNGRTGRLLMNLILMKAGYPPVVIRKEEKHKYYQYLDTANKGDVRPFIRFIAKCAERTLDEYLWALSENPNVTYPELRGREPIDDGRTIILEEVEDET